MSLSIFWEALIKFLVAENIVLCQEILQRGHYFSFTHFQKVALGNYCSSHGNNGFIFSRVLGKKEVSFQSFMGFFLLLGNITKCTKRNHPKFPTHIFLNHPPLFFLKKKSIKPYATIAAIPFLSMELLIIKKSAKNLSPPPLRFF